MATNYNTSPALREVIVLEATWTDCPEDVKNDIRELWSANELGNDYYYYSWDKGSIEYAEEKYPALYRYLEEKGVTKCLIHYWW